MNQDVRVESDEAGAPGGQRYGLQGARRESASNSAMLSACCHMAALRRF
ncbi:hypothetical protein ACQB6R_02160 [Propionibacteriaceae bacterium G1746]